MSPERNRSERRLSFEPERLDCVVCQDLDMLFRWGPRVGVLLFALVASCVPAGTSLADRAAPVAPHLRFDPTSGVVGTVVHYRGRLTRAELRSDTGYVDRFLSTELGPKHDPTCELYVHLRRNHLHINRRDGSLHGSFIIGRYGTCAQSNGKPHRVRPGHYGFSLGCVVCAAGKFHITE